MMGYTKTAILMAAMTALFMAVGYALGGGAGLLIALVVAIGMNGYSYWNSDKAVLRMHKAQECNSQVHPDLERMVHRLADGADMPRPRVFVINRTNPTPLPQGATRKMPPWRRPPGCCAACRMKRSPPSWRMSWRISAISTRLS